MTLSCVAEEVAVETGGESGEPAPGELASAGVVNLWSLYLRRAAVPAALAGVAALISGAATTVLLAMLNSIVTAGNHWTPGIVWPFAALCAVRLAAGAGAHWLLTRLAQRAVYHLRMDLSRGVLRAPLRQIETLGAAKLVSAFGDDVASLSVAITNVPYFVVNLVIIAGCLGYMGWLSAPLAAGMAACAAVGVTSYLLPVVWANRRLRRARQQQDALYAHFDTLVRGNKELKLHAGRAEVFLRDFLEPAARRVERENVWGVGVYGIAANWNRLLFFVYAAAMLWWLPRVEHATVVQLAGYLTVLLYVMAPLEAIMNALPHMARANAALRGINRLNLELAAQPEAAVVVDSGSRPWQAIELAEVTHRYERGPASGAFRLGPVSLRFSPGEVVFLTGGNGSGKTTLLKVLTGLYPPVGGELRLDGAAGGEAERGAYRQLFAAVFADFCVLPTVAGGAASALREGERYLEWLGLHGLVEIREGAFSRVDLSQGQRKRLALAQALMDDRAV